MVIAAALTTLLAASFSLKQSAHPPGCLGVGTSLGDFGSSSGAFPDERTFTNLFSRSNQNGAPREAASAVRSQPRIVVGPNRRSTQPMGNARFPIASVAAVNCCCGFRCCKFFSTKECAASLTESRSGELTPARLLVIRTLSTLPSTTIKSANASWTACVFRLYQPETRSIVELNQISSWVLN